MEDNRSNLIDALKAAAEAVGGIKVPEPPRFDNVYASIFNTQEMEDIIERMSHTQKVFSMSAVDSLESLFPTKSKIEQMADNLRHQGKTEKQIKLVIKLYLEKEKRKQK
jgi:hypothetical protein